MPLSAAILPEFDHEVSNTRITLERVPEDRFDWRPHPKSPTLGSLASHLAEVPQWTDVTINQDELDFGDGSYVPKTVTSRAELLAMFDANVAAARKAIANASDETLMQMWTMRRGDHVILSMPKIAVLRGFIMSHSIHHRAQLGLYLRLNDVPVPAIYGPSADEGSM